MSLPYSSLELKENDMSLQKLSGNFEFLPVNEEQQLNKNFFFNMFNIGDFIRLNYLRIYPLDMAISQQCIHKYNAIFFFIIKMKRINQILSMLWKYLSSSEFKRIPSKDAPKIRRINLLRQKMQHFISMME
mmetsp:Transcript_11229/g.11288  ORF Transcript_11229/g.11288 Transcript_11229/m.11288 type:complete len:131 (-) Transcript_11229:41-433(-)